MTEHREHDEHPELLLAGADRPRPLSLALRSRLEGALAAVATIPDETGEPARPLSVDVRDRLESRLRPPERGRSWPPPGKWKAITASAGAAAAIVFLAAVVVPGLVHGPRTAPHGNTLSAGAPPRGVRKAAPSRAPKALFSPAGRPTRAQAPKLAPVPNTTQTYAVPHAAGAQLAPPVVRLVTPRRGPARGGNWVFVSGGDMDGVNAVYFGPVAAVRFSEVSHTELKVLAPAHSPGTVDIVVVRPSGRSAVSPDDRYSFVPDP